MSYPVQPPPVATAAAAPPAPPGRPATVSAATVLLWVMAVAGLIYAIATLAVVPGTVDRFRGLSGNPSGPLGTDGTDPEYYVAVVWLGAAVALALAVIVFALFVVLGLALRRGSNAARIATLVMCVLGVLAGGVSLLILGAQRSGETAPWSLGAQLSQSYPSGWIGTNATLAVAQILGYVVVAVLILVTPRVFFRREPAPVAPPAPGQPAYGMPYPGYGVAPAPAGYGSAQPGYGSGQPGPASGQPGYGYAAGPGQGYGYAGAPAGVAAPSGPSPYARPVVGHDPAYGGFAMPDRSSPAGPPVTANTPVSDLAAASPTSGAPSTGPSVSSVTSAAATKHPAPAGPADPNAPVAFPLGSTEVRSALPSVKSATSPGPVGAPDSPVSGGQPGGQAPASGSEDEYWSRPSD